MNCCGVCQNGNRALGQEMMQLKHQETALYGEDQEKLVRIVENGMIRKQETNYIQI